jgi:hypothetical protein
LQCALVAGDGKGESHAQWKIQRSDYENGEHARREQTGGNADSQHHAFERCSGQAKVCAIHTTKINGADLEVWAICPFVSGFCVVSEPVLEFAVLIVLFV